MSAPERRRSGGSVGPPQVDGRTARAGLNFPVGLVGRSLKRGGFSQRIGGGAPVYVAAVLEYLATEVLDLAGHAADLEFRASGGESSDAGEPPVGGSRRAVKTITPAHIEQAIRSDNELQHVMRDIAAPASQMDQFVAAAAAAAEAGQQGEEEEEEEEEEEGSQGDEESEAASQGGESQASQEPTPLEHETAERVGESGDHDLLPASATHFPSSAAAASSPSAAVPTTPISFSSPDAALAAAPSSGSHLKRPSASADELPASKRQMVHARPKPAVPLFDGTLAPSPTTHTPIANAVHASTTTPSSAAALSSAASALPSTDGSSSSSNSSVAPSSAHAAAPSVLSASASPFTDNLQALCAVMPHIDLLTCSRVLEAQQNNLAKAILSLHQLHPPPTPAPPTSTTAPHTPTAPNTPHSAELS